MVRGSKSRNIGCSKPARKSRWSTAKASPLVVYWVITGHDGDIDTTVSDAGTTVTITLPHSTGGTASDEVGELASLTPESRELFQSILRKQPIRW